MNRRTLFLVVLLGVLPSLFARSQDDAAPVPGSVTAAAPEADLHALVAQVQAKLKVGQETAAALAPEIAAFDTLLAKYHDQKSDAVAQILLMKASLFLEVLEDEATGRTLLAQVKADFPGTKAAKEVDSILARLERATKARELQATLVGKAAPEIHLTWSSREGLKSLADLKGKVVVIDFWATWCGPCVRSFPQVRELVEHYKGFDVEVIGVTSLQGRVHGLEAKPIDTRGDPAREKALMRDYIKAKDMTWTIAFSEENVFNPDYGVMGIPYMAIIAPDGTVRHTGLHPAMPSAEKYTKVDAILKEFGREVPASAKM
jgi:thiol-disulfide isomerase/thioredoxin